MKGLIIGIVIVATIAIMALWASMRLSSILSAEEENRDGK